MDSNEPPSSKGFTRKLAAALLLLVTLLLCGLWIRSHHTFDYWTSPDLLKKNHRVSLGSAWGRIMIAYGWPSATSPWWRPNSEPLFGNEPDLKAEERARPEEHLDFARQQFGFQIDGVAEPVNYPFVIIPIWVIVLLFASGASALLITTLARQSGDDAHTVES